MNQPTTPNTVEEIRALLTEAYGFKSTSPKAQESINAALDLLDSIADRAQRTPAAPVEPPKYDYGPDGKGPVTLLNPMSPRDRASASPTAPVVAEGALLDLIAEQCKDWPSMGNVPAKGLLRLTRAAINLAAHPVAGSPAEARCWSDEVPCNKCNAVGWHVCTPAAAEPMPADPMDWPLPCDVKVGAGTIKAGCTLRTLVERMHIMNDMIREGWSSARVEPMPVSEAPDRHREFTEGVVYAAARMVELFDQPTMAEDILNESGVNVELGCEDDLAFVRKIERFKDVQAATAAPVPASEAAKQEFPQSECNAALRAAPAVTYALPLPMSSAPHDGTEVLAWSVTGKTWHQVYWKTQANGEWAWLPPFPPRWACRWNGEYSQGQHEFSYWLPIPSEPDELLAATDKQPDATDWVPLARRLYVELFHCHQQMISTTDENDEPMWLPGVGVPAVLADAKAALESATRFRAEGGNTNGSTAHFAAPAAPTDARADCNGRTNEAASQGDIPEPGYSDSLADRIFNMPCNWKGDASQHSAILMGHTMACEQAYRLVMSEQPGVDDVLAALQAVLDTTPQMRFTGTTKIGIETAIAAVKQMLPTAVMAVKPVAQSVRDAAQPIAPGKDKP